jgi:hypothetical protein
MRFLRYVAGYNRWDEISNLTVHIELQIFNINDKIKDKKEQYDHIQWMDLYRITHKAVKCRPIGYRHWTTENMGR